MFKSPSYTFTIFATVHQFSSGFDIDSKIVVYKDGKIEIPAALRFLSYGVSMVHLRILQDS